MVSFLRDSRLRCRVMASLMGVTAVLFPASGQADDQAGYPAGAQYCGRLADIEVALANEFDEHLTAVAEASGDVVRLYVSASLRTWTLLAIAAVRPDWACLIGGGTGFDFVRPPSSGAVSS